MKNALGAERASAGVRDLPYRQQPREQAFEPRRTSVSSPSSFSSSRKVSDYSGHLKILRQLEGRLVEHLLRANGLPLATIQSNLPSHNTFHLLLLHGKGLSSKINETRFLATHPAKATWVSGQVRKGRHGCEERAGDFSPLRWTRERPVMRPATLTPLQSLESHSWR